METWILRFLVLALITFCGSPSYVKAGPRFASVRTDILDTDSNQGKSEVEVKENKKDKSEKWVVDSIYYDDYQGDDPGQTVQYDLCPPVPDAVTEHECGIDKCQSDTDCAESFRCCYNGCSFACLVEVEPAAVVDWRKEPRRSRSGISWLVEGPRIQTGDGVPCTTTPVEPDEDPLLCPHGYFCHVDHPGNPEKEIPNKGYCVKETDDLLVSAEDENSALATPKSCYIDNYVLLDGAKMRFKDRICRCKRGFLSCSRRHKNSKDGDVIIQAKDKQSRKRRRKKKSRKDRNRS